MRAERWNNLDYLQMQTMAVAMEVRNAMEDFHCEHLSDAQMAELNPIIRNAIYTALKLWDAAVDKDEAALRSVNWLAHMVPDYWEDPVSDAQERLDFHRARITEGQPDYFS